MSRFTTILKHSKKVCLPVLKPGSLLSARYKGVVLGDVQFVHPRFFKNSITVDMSVVGKNVNIKISKGNLQMCGIKNVEMAEKAAMLIFEHIIRAEKLLEKTTEAHLSAAKDYVMNKDESVLEGMNDSVMEKLLYFATKCTEMEKFDEMLEDVRKAISRKDSNIQGENGSVVLLSSGNIKPINLLGIRKAMVNYNFSLGFKVNRGELAIRINGVSDFTARYNNTLDYSVIIEHPHDLVVVNRKKESPHVTFTIYRSGILTISGPDYETIEPIYKKFIEIIKDIRPFIEAGY